MNPDDELVYEVDDEDNVLRVVRRGVLTDEGLRHRSVAVLFRDDHGHILVHRRAAAKRVFPQYYDMFVAGMVPAGETYQQAAVRECAEEIGAVGVRLTERGKFRYDDERVPQWTVVYEAAVTGPVVPQEAEIEWFGFLAPDEVRASFEDWQYCPDSLYLYRSVFLGG